MKMTPQAVITIITDIKLKIDNNTATLQDIDNLFNLAEMTGEKIPALAKRGLEILREDLKTKENKNANQTNTH